MLSYISSNISRKKYPPNESISLTLGQKFGMIIYIQALAIFIRKCILNDFVEAAFPKYWGDANSTCKGAEYEM